MSPMTDPTRDEAVRSLIERYDAAMACQKESPDASLIVMANYGDLAINHLRAMLDSAPAPASGGVDAVGVCGISADTESKRVLKLHFKHEVTDADRKTIIDAFNTLNRERRSALSTAATPVSEAVRPIGNQGISDYQREIARNMAEGFAAWNAARQEALPSDEPASSPAGGDQSLGAMLNHAASTIRGLEERIALYRANYTTNSALDHGRRQIIDDFEKFLHERAALSQSTSAGRVGE